MRGRKTLAEHLAHVGAEPQVDIIFSETPALVDLLAWDHSTRLQGNT